jgi:uncharacterized protein YacL
VRKEQTRRQALKETVATRFVGFIVALITAELFVYEMFGVTVSITQNLGIMIYWSFQSILVGYMLRRFFENREK